MTSNSSLKLVRPHRGAPPGAQARCGNGGGATRSTRPLDRKCTDGVRNNRRSDSTMGPATSLYNCVRSCPASFDRHVLLAVG